MLVLKMMSKCYMFNNLMGGVQEDEENQYCDRRAGRCWKEHCIKRVCCAA